MQQHKKKIKGIDTSWFEIGQGQPIIVLHGWGASSLSWQSTASHLASLGYCLIVPDLPGFGQSSEPAVPWSLNDYVDWLQIFIQERDLSDFILLGHSFGGRLVIKFVGSAGSQADQIKGLVLCGAAGLRDNRWVSCLKRSFFLMLAKLGKLVLVPFSGLRSFAQKMLYRVAKEHDYEKSSAIMKQILRLAVREDLTDDLPEITSQTLLVWGAEDKFTPLRDAEKMNKLIKKSLLVVIENSGHDVYRSQIDEFAGVVDCFCQRLSLEA